MTAEIKPEERVLIAALRAGKRMGEAFDEYCWAKSVVPIREEDLRRAGDPFKCRPHSIMTMAEAMASDAFDKGATDEEIATAFRAGGDVDRERGVLYRPMKDDERPSPAELIRSMGRDDQMEAARLFGLRAVAHAVAGGEIEFRRDSDTRPQDGDAKQ